MPRLRIVPKNHHDFATLTVVGGASATGFNVTDTQNMGRSRIWLASSAGDRTIRGTLAAPKTADSFHLFGHNAHAGNIEIELFTDAAWVTSADTSGPLPADNVSADSTYDWGEGDVDPLLSAAPYWYYFDSPVTYQSYEITFSGGAAPYEARRISLGLALEARFNPAYGAQIGIVDRSDRNRSRGGSLRTQIGAKWRFVNFELGWIPENQRATWMDIMSWCGTSRDFVCSWFPEEGSRMERDHTFNGCFSSLDAIGRPTPAFLTKRFQIEEV